MTTRWPAGRILPLLETCASRSHSLKPVYHVASFQIRQYASQPSRPPHRIGRQNQPSASVSDFNPQSALQTVLGDIKLHPLNPPPSTRPPPLHLPTRGPENVFKYWLRIGRAYGSFYKGGIKAVWYNGKARRLLANRYKATYSIQDVYQAAGAGIMARSEFIMLVRTSRDSRKLPLFGALVLIFGEWLPLLVPFIPNAVPSTCRIPKQVEGMRRRTEQRRRTSFRSGVEEPSLKLIADRQKKGEPSWSLGYPDSRRKLLDGLRHDQLLHLSTTFNLHSSVWERFRVPPPTFLLRYRLNVHIAFLAYDDWLLTCHRGLDQLHPDELLIACEQRGMDVLGKSQHTLRELLSQWMAYQEHDEARGAALLLLMFRRSVDSRLHLIGPLVSC